MKIFKPTKTSHKFMWMLLQLFITMVEPISDKKLNKTNSVANPYFNNKFANLGALKNSK